MTDQSDRTAKVTLQYVVDRASLNQVAQSTDAVRNQLKDVGQSTNAIAISAQQAGKSLKDAFSSTKTYIDSNLDSIKAMREELVKLDVDEKGMTAAGRESYAQRVGYGVEGGQIGPALPPDSGGDANGGPGVSGLRRSGAILNQIVPGAGAPLQIAGAGLQLSKTFGLITDGFKSMAAAGGPATDVVKGLGGEVGVLAAAGGLAVVAIGGIVAAAAIFKGELDSDSKGLADAVTYVDDYYKAIEKGTTDSINAQIKEAEISQAIEQEKVKTLQASYDAAHPKPQLTNGQDADFGAAITGLFSDLSGGGKQLNKDLEDSKKQLNDTSVELQALKAALGDSAVAANNAAAAEAKLQAARDSAAEKHITQVTQTAQLEATGTTKQIQDRLAAIKAERDAINDQIRVGNLSTAETAKLDQRFHDLTDEMERDTKVIGPLVAAREKLAQAEKDALKVAQDKLKADEKQQQDSVATLDKYNTAVQSAEDSAAQARINANGKLQDALVKAAQDAVDKSTAALAQLEQKRADNLTSLDRDLGKQSRASGDQQLEDQIKAQRQERDDLQTHLDNLKQIRDADAGRLRDDLLNRNFRDTFALGEQKNQDAAKESERFTEQQQKRNQALDDQGADEARAQVIQRRERLISYQNANQDALKQYNLELQQAAQAKARAIQQAQQGNAKELATINSSLITKEALLKQGAINDIKLVQQTEDQKQAIFLAKLEQVNQLLGIVSAQNALPSQHTGSRAVLLAGGGDLASGQRAIVNEPGSTGNESFNGVPFPKSMGLFIPLKSGNVNPGRSGGGDINIPITVNEASTPAATAAAIRPMVIKIIREVGRH